MKLSETNWNVHQKMAYVYICESMSEWIGGLENTLMDYDESTEEYKQAQEFLNQSRDYLVDYIYKDIMQACDKSFDKHLRFAGEKFIKQRIEKRLIKWGY